MLVYKAPIRDIRFLLETLGYDDVTQIAAFEDFDLDTMMALVEQAGKFCTNEMLPANRIGDEEGVQFDPETKEVKTPAVFK